MGAMTEGRRAERPARDGFAEALRQGIAARGLSLDRLRYHLRARGHELSVATLSYWQSGRSRPERASSLSALSALEDILLVPEGSLLRLLPPTRSAMPDEAALPVTDPQDRHLEQLLARLGTPRDDGYLRISLYERIDVDAAGGVGTRIVREVIQATREGLSAFPVVTRHESAAGQAQLRGLLNCSIGHVIRRPHRIAGQIVLDRPLHLGEAAVVEYAIDVEGERAREMSWERPCTNRLRQLHVEITFDAAERLPLVAEVFTRVGGRASVEPIAIVDHRLSCLTQDFGPGVYGVRWRW